MLDDRKCLIRLTEEALLVANTGQGFTRRGVVAICASHLGTKHNYTPSDPCPSEPDDCVLEAIRERELQTYKTNPDRIFSDFREEEEIQHDYGGRALWELLQNADDAMSPPETTPAQLIGSKGLGFKSVLELTEEPQIHSGPFHFHFSTVETRTLLQGGMPPNQDPPPLIFRIPHPGAANNGVKDLLNKGYVTIICLPLREEARPKVHKWLKDLDPRLLLFCQYLRTLELGFPDGQSRLYEVNRGDFGLLKDADITVQVVESTLGGVITEHTLHYRRWAATKDAKNGGKRHSAAICLQIKEGQLVPFADTPPLHVFFPTKESLPFRALVHASFEVEQSRQHVREMDTELFSLLEGLLARIVHEAPPAVVLGAFVPEREPSSEPAQRIWELVKAVLQECTFVPTIGGDLVKPGGTWLWSHELGTVLDPVSEAVKKSALVVPELMEFVRKPLEILGASELTVSKYPHLLQHCLNVDSEACLKAAKVLRQVVLKSSEMDEQTSNSHISTCRKVPCWWTDDGQARALEEDRPLLKSRPKQSPPKWVELDALDEQFRKRVEELLLSKEADQQGGGKRWYDLTSGHLLEADDHNLLHKVLIPTLARHPEDEWWSEHGGETLQLFVQWAGEPEFEKTSLVIWEKEERIRLAHCLKLPTNRGWLSTGQCYAGEAWGGPDSFDDFFREVTDRGVLKAPEQWPDKIQPLDPEKWKGRLRYAGVSWEPKLLRFKSSEGLRFRVQDTPPNPWMKSSKDNRGEVRNWSYWNDYCSSLKQKFPSSGTTRLREQWALEFFPECLPEEALDRISILTLMSKVVVKSYSKMEFKLDNRKSPAFVDSLAIYQLQKVAWLPCKPSLLHEDSYVAPFEAYMPGKGLGGLLPEVNVDLADGQEGRDLATFLTQTLKVRETLPGPTDKQWTEWLNKLPEVAGRSKKDITSTARELYKKILGFDRKPLESVQVKLVPCLVWSDTAGEEMRQGTSAEGKALDFRGKNDVYWLDKSYLDDQSVKEELLRNGAAIFLLELDDGEKAGAWLGLRPFSEVVEVEPQYQQENEDITSQLVERYRQRYRAIQVLAHKQKGKVPEPDDISFRAVSKLNLRISYQDEEVAILPVSWWKTDDGSFLVEADKCWLGAGRAIADTTKGKIADVIENLLRASSDEEVLDRLRAQGVAESELQDPNLRVEPSVQKLPPPDKTPSQLQPEKMPDQPQPSSATGAELRPTHTSTQAGSRGRGGWSNQEAQEGGREAEEWLRERLKEILPETWNVSSGSVRDSKGRETDILLRNGEEAVHIEVKHMKSDPQLYWSEREVDKAKKAREQGKRYFMALLSPNREANGYNIGWLWNPLNDLRECWERRTIRGIWIWEEKRQLVDFQELTEEPWQIPNPRANREANNFSFEIRLNGLKYSATGLEAILTKLPLIEQAQGLEGKI